MTPSISREKLIAHLKEAIVPSEKVLEWAKKHNWPTTGGHRVIGFDKLKEFLESLRGGATEQGGER